ncbi:MAG: glycosyltransferase family 39 protein [Deltaproteobacteria bacterium]|nr:glycosyltransferase family 39 protein [Deltaproteobacteria bacterium]
MSNIVPKSLSRIPSKDFILCILLALLIALPYWRIQGHDFVNLDDDHYITENPMVREGFTLKGVVWALSINDIDYWHPVTWLSHMADFQLYGMHPRGHHLTNLLFHIINSLLLFIILKKMTGASWRSAAVALLFGLHPLNVESVAWVAERKNVISTFFWMTTILSYVRYTERPLLSRYVLTLVSFALGLMSKPTIATLPFVLLLLDYWPIGRLEIPFDGKTKEDSGDKSATRLKSCSPGHLLVEKIPFLALSVACVLISSSSTGQQDIMVSTSTVPLALRLENALISYLIYIRKMIWPMDLAVFYPFPKGFPAWQILGALIVLLAITFMATRSARRHPYLFVGWAWYICTLFPAIGLVQVGLWPATADRFVYIP